MPIPESWAQIIRLDSNFSNFSFTPPEFPSHGRLGNCHKLYNNMNHSLPQNFTFSPWKQKKNILSPSFSGSLRGHRGLGLIKSNKISWINHGFLFVTSAFFTFGFCLLTQSICLEIKSFSHSYYNHICEGQNNPLLNYLGAFLDVYMGMLSNIIMAHFY